MRKDGVSEHCRHLGYFDCVFPGKAVLFISPLQSFTWESRFLLHSCLLLSWLEFKVCFIATLSLPHTRSLPSVSLPLTVPNLLPPTHFQCKEHFVTNYFPQETDFSLIYEYSHLQPYITSVFFA